MVQSGSRRYVGSVAKGLSTNPDFVSTTEIDNHADTCCFGANFTPIYFTGHVCQVQPFIDSYESMSDVQICSAATAYDDPESGATYILVFHQGLWFGPKLIHSLINPNQLRSFGILLCDDPFDPYRDLSIHDPISEFTIPLTMHGTICAFQSRTPRPDELQNCPHIVLTSEAPWDPSSLEIPLGTKREASNELGSKYRHAHEMKSTIRSPQSSRFDMLDLISPVFSGPSLLSALVSTVHVNEKQISSVNTQTRHSEITPKELARKWRIGLQAAKDTLKVTTQHGIRHAIHPLKRRYRTDHMSLSY